MTYHAKQSTDSLPDTRVNAVIWKNNSCTDHRNGFSSFLHNTSTHLNAASCTLTTVGCTVITEVIKAMPSSATNDDAMSTSAHRFAKALSHAEDTSALNYMFLIQRVIFFGTFCFI
jgi:hypothetical protein